MTPGVCMGTFFLVLVSLLSGCSIAGNRGSDAPPGRDVRFPTDPGQAGEEARKLVWRITSTAFEDGERIPAQYTADGQDISPPLQWTAPPEGTVELALVADDPDAPAGTWVHWVLYALPPDTAGLPEGVEPAETLEQPPRALQGRNDFGAVGWGGPAPPRGHGVHHYNFTLYALDAPSRLEPGATKQQLLAAVEGHIVAMTKLTGTYSR